MILQNSGQVSIKLKKREFLVVQWLGFHAFTAKGMGSISGQGTKILKATRHSQIFFLIIF